METIMAYARKYSLNVSVPMESYRFSGVPNPPRHIVDLTEEEEEEDDGDLDLVEIYKLWMATELDREANLAEEDLNLEEIYMEWMTSELVEEEAETQRIQDEKAILDAGFEAVWTEYLAKREM